MSNKDKVNKISGILSLVVSVIILLGYITNNNTLLGFPNMMIFYLLVPLVLIWFGTRRNGCGSCNQIDSISKPEQNKDVTNNI